VKRDSNSFALSGRMTQGTVNLCAGGESQNGMTRRQFALSIAAATTCVPLLFEPTLSPSGVPRGVVPGGVTWAHDPAAVTWDGTGSWWTDANNNQAVIDRMVSRSIRGLTNQKKRCPGMERHLSVFQSHAWSRQRRIQGRREGRDQGEPEQHNGPWHDRRLNSSPHLILSLVRQLTGPGRVPQSSITVFDSSRFIPGNLYDKIHHEFPGVVFVDHIGGDGRLKAEFKPNAIPFSVKAQRHGTRYHGG
jgi:hypothetical protein